MDLFQDSDMESDVEMENEDTRGIAQGMGRKKNKKTGIGSPSRLVMAVIVIVSLIIVFAVFANVGGKVTIEDLNLLINRLDKLENNNANYQELENNIAQLTKQVNTLQASIASLEQSGSSLSKELGKLNKQRVLLKSDIPPIPPASNPIKAPTPAVAVEKKSVVETKLIAEKKPAVEKKAIPQPKRVYHEVQQGETLFAIARKYDISITELYSLNNLSSDKAISPGMKIIVK